MSNSYIYKICLVLPVLLQQYSANAQSRASACLQPPTVEGCSLIRRMWSFNAASEQCEQNFVCSNHTNAFQDKASCMAMCPSGPSPQPPESHRGCDYWILRLDQCKRTWWTLYRDGWGVPKRAFIYTGCGPSPHRYYAYYVDQRRCEELRFRGGRAN
uniref:Putative monolaris n=1 Tax=Rhipicephalus pulchellus TaxID=72859 RepID=L7MC30_RHIPC